MCPQYSSYLDWYIHVPEVRCDFRSSGISLVKYNLAIGEVDLSVNYAYGNPEMSELLTRRYQVQPESVFISTEGTSGQNSRIIRCIAERNKRKNEAIVEYPTYEPLLRKAQKQFPRVKRLERKEDETYRLDVDALAKLVSEKTALLVLTNPHAPSGAISSENELEEIMTIAHEHEFYVLCDEIYSEFDRNALPTIFSVNPELGITTTSFTKAYGLGGLKLGIALAGKDLVDGLYKDVLNTVGNSPNIVQLIAIELLSKNIETLEKHKEKWLALKSVTEEWLEEHSLEYFPNKMGITYWVKLPTDDTYKWINKHAIPKHSLAAVPGTFFLFKSNHRLQKSNKIRLGLGNIPPDKLRLLEALQVLEKVIETY
ncbi:MAG: pyridoxal phosphate-dependent aminotransferase [Candidatus Bathyarchaeota archaeon]|nr:pyridoxal phosphate-dependent aminotransferase [Candidatus Bathyarchaeota archaeon]